MAVSDAQLRLEKANWLAITVTLAVMLVPFVWLALYAQPFADDFAYARKALDRGFIGSLIFDYQTWNGRFASNLLVLRNPMTTLSGLFYYKAFSIFMMLLTVRVAWLLTGRILTESKTARWLATLLFTVTYLALMPTIAEGIYWYTGVVTYHAGNLIMIMALYWLTSDKFKGLGVLFLFLSMGFNEVQTGTICALITIGLISPKFRLVKLPFAGYGLVIAGLLLMLLSPGNSGRAAEFSDNMNWAYSAGMSAIQTCRFMALWMITPMYWVFWLVLVVLPFKLNDKFKSWLSNVPAWALVFMALVTTYICAFLPYLGTGILGQHRTFVTACFVFVLLSGLLALKLKSAIMSKVSWLSWFINPLPVMILFGLLIAGNGFQAVFALASGQAKGYDQECTDRMIQCHTQSLPEQDMVFAPIKHRPPALFVLDLTEDPEHWINENYAIVNGVRSVKVIGED